MNDLDRLNQALDYIEAHLDAPLDAAALGRILTFPVGLFQRMFPILTGMPLSEYIRRRRLTMAAFELQATPVRLIDLALRYGYESADAFAVAFRRQHGVAPSAVRSRAVTFRSYPRLRFSMSIQGGTEMNYQVFERPAFRVIGQSIITSQENNRISAFWIESNQDGTSERICRMMRAGAADRDPRAGSGTADRNAGRPGHADVPTTDGSMLGVCYDMRDDGTFRYLIGVETDADAAAAAAAGLELVEIPASTWLGFESVGPMPQAIQSVWSQIFTEFLPGSIYRHAGIPELELYQEGDIQSDDYTCAVWVPVVPK